jgi:flagellar FliJ protein
MKKFKFRLEKLLDAKNAKEKAVKLELAHAVSEQNVFRAKQNDYRERVQNQKNVIHDLMRSGKISIDQLKQYHNFEYISDLAIEDSQNRIEAMEPAINVIRVKLNEAVKERRTIEKLKERKKAEWQYKVTAAEYKEIDDMNQKLYMRRIVEDMKERRYD